MGGYNGYNGYQNSVEIFNPITRRTCIVGSMTMARASHTMCNNMVCGGGSGVRSHKSQDSCEKFDGISGFSSLPVKLVHGRLAHLCWGLKSGDVLLLGTYSMRPHYTETTERVSADGTSSSYDFKLAYKTRMACGIEVDDKFVVTGGLLLGYIYIYIFIPILLQYL